MSDHTMFGPKKRSVFGVSSGGSDVDEFAVDLNLTPLMDVMSNILFFLLAGFGAAIISFLAATVPVQSDSDAPPDAPRTDKVTVNLQIATEGYKISISNDRLPAEELTAAKQLIAKGGAAYDNAGLSRALLGIKQKYPASDTIMIVPSDSTVYEEIVAAMDASKDMKQQEGPRVRLFPKAVIADLVKADAVDPATVPSPATGEGGAVPAPVAPGGP